VCMMMLRPGSLLEMYDSPRARGLPSRCDLRAFNYTCIQAAAIRARPHPRPACAVCAARAVKRDKLGCQPLRLPKWPGSGSTSAALSRLPGVASVAKDTARDMRQLTNHGTSRPTARHGRTVLCWRC
jgi:hypothetical protein